MKLNENEFKTLLACLNEIVSCTGCEFGVTENVKVEGLEVNQLKGYLSKLKNKELITIDPGYMDQRGQIHLTHKACDYLLGLPMMQEQFERIDEIKNNI